MGKIITGGFRRRTRRLLARVKARLYLACSHRSGGIVLVVVFFAACDAGSPSVRPAQPSPVAESPSAAGREIAGCLDLPPTVPEGMMRVELWFGDALDRSAVAASLVVHRDIPQTGAIAGATLRAWIQGPTEKEEIAGAYPATPDGTVLLGIDVDDKAAVVDLNGAFEETGVGTTYEGAILEQLAGTITQFEMVDRALLKINGEFKQHYMGHGFIVDEEHPLTRPGKSSYRVAQKC